MNRYFFTLFFTLGKFGWSEVFPIAETNDANATTAATAIRSARQACSYSDVTMIGRRLSNSDIKGDSIPCDTGYPHVGTYAGSGVTASYRPEIALRMGFVDGTNVHRGTRWLRGLPEDQFDAAGNYTPNAGFLTNLSNYVLDVQGNVSIAHKIKGAVAAPFYAFYAPISQYAAFTAEPRKIGRPFGQPRGRREIA